MTVSSTVNKIIYTGTGATDTYVYPFSIYAKTDLVITEVVIATELETELVVDSDYTVEVDVDGNFTGNVILLDGNLASTKKLVIQRILPLTQQTDYTKHGPLPSETHEQGLDRAIQICQQLQEQIDRCLKISVFSTEEPTSDELMEELNTAVGAAAESESNAAASETAAAASQVAAAASAAAALASQQSLNLPTLAGAGDATKLLQVNAGGTGYDLMTRATLQAAIGVPAGGYIPFGASVAPSGWLNCDGSAVSRTTYAALFAAISTSYGVGDGSTTFNVPDMRGRFALGLDNLGGTPANRVTHANADSVGGAEGAETKDISHTHSVSGTTDAMGGGLTRIDDNSGGSDYDWQNPTSHTHTFSTTSGSGGSATQNVMNPYLAGGYIIKT